MIYEPAGRAKEYAELACNLYVGCAHGCQYCYVPMAPYVDRSSFEVSKLKKDVLKYLEKACIKHRGDPRPVLMCFTCDPYQPEGIEDVTREALLIMEHYNINVDILTKGGSRAIRDFDILARNNWTFGSSINMSPLQAKLIEPCAAPVEDRIRALQVAKQHNIKTWVSIEPVIYPDSALDMIRYFKVFGGVDVFKVGKINHVDQCMFSDELKNRIKAIDWKWFLREVYRELDGLDYYIKRDLLEAAGRITNISSGATRPQ